MTAAHQDAWNTRNPEKVSLAYTKGASLTLSHSEPQHTPPIPSSMHPCLSCYCGHSGSPRKDSYSLSWLTSP
jgi:hypothetical protein